MEDQAPQEEFVFVSVENPVIHNTYDEGRYTTYDVILQPDANGVRKLKLRKQSVNVNLVNAKVTMPKYWYSLFEETDHVETNSLSFTTKHSVVKRRYSDFQWLRKTLSRTTGGNIPSLPVGWRWFGTFDEAFLKKRQQVLTDFLKKIVKDTLLISNTAFHLFMQTELNQREMDRLLRIPASSGGRSMNSLDSARAAYGSEKPVIPSRRSDVGLAAQMIGNRIGNAFLPCRSLPVLHGFSSGASPNETTASLERDPMISLPDSKVSDGDRKPAVVGSFSSDGANALMHGNSLRRHVEEEDCEGWVVLEDDSNVPQRNNDQDKIPTIEDLKPGDLKPEDYTNVSWRIGEISPSCSPSSTSYIPKSSSSSSLHSSSTQQTVHTDCEVKRYIVEDNLPSFRDPCCSQSLPIHIPAMKTIKYNALSSSVLESGSSRIPHKDVEVDATNSDNLDVGDSGDYSGSLDTLKLTESVTVHKLNVDEEAKKTSTEDNQANIEKEQNKSPDDSNKDVEPCPQSHDCDVQEQKEDEENPARGVDYSTLSIPSDNSSQASHEQPSDPNCVIPSEPGNMVHGKSVEPNSEPSFVVSGPSP